MFKALSFCQFLVIIKGDTEDMLSMLSSNSVVSVVGQSFNQYYMYVFEIEYCGSVYVNFTISKGSKHDKGQDSLKKKSLLAFKTTLKISPVSTFH